MRGSENMNNLQAVWNQNETAIEDSSDYEDIYRPWADDAEDDAADIQIALIGSRTLQLPVAHRCSS
jgi:hypothetical protein